jgi:5'-nucleotidase
MERNGRKRLLLDMDSCIADIMAKWLPAYNRDYGDNMTVADIKTFDVWESTKIGKKMEEYLWIPGFYRDFSVIPGAREGVTEIQKMGVEVFILTSPGRNVGCIPDKDAWLNQHFPEIDYRHRIYTGAKYVCQGEYFIDDSPPKIRPWRAENPNGRALSIKYNYNKDEPAYDLLAHDFNDTRAAWAQMAEYIRQDLEEKEQYARGA